MPFRPGQSGNLNGRPRGAKTKLSLKTREGIWKHIEQLASTGRDGNPFSVLIGLMLDSSDEHIRLHAATALADRLLTQAQINRADHGPGPAACLPGDARDQAGSGPQPIGDRPQW